MNSVTPILVFFDDIFRFARFNASNVVLTIT